MRLLNLLRNSVAAGVVLFSIGTVFHLAVPLLMPTVTTAYTDHPEVFRTWPGWTRAYMICHPFFYGFVFASGFHVIQAIKRGTIPLGTRNGMIYGLLVFAIGSLPVYLLNYGALRVPGIVITAWVVQGLLQYAAAGALLGCMTDGVVVSITTKLPLSADEAWQTLTRKSTFLYITRGMVGYSGAEAWPERLFCPRASIVMKLRLFHFLPPTPHFVEIVRVDEDARQVETRESGGIVRIWKHHMQVEAIHSNLCRYTDRIEIQAGLLTPAVWLFAILFYRYRQMRWRMHVQTILQSQRLQQGPKCASNDPLRTERAVARGSTD